MIPLTIETLDAIRHEKARRSLTEYAGLVTFGKWKPARHLKLVISALERIEQGKLDRLIITMPPRHGKTMLCSEIFPSWFIGKHPSESFINTAYGSDLAMVYSERARDHLRTFGDVLWGVRVSRSSASKKRWSVEGNTGGMIAAGTGGPIAGFGARVANIDDPIKNWKDAQSAAKRDAAWDWYRTVLRTRLTPDGAIIITTTRWHEDDLPGRLIKIAHDEAGEDVDQWEVINLPAVSTGEGDALDRPAGEPLWPERYGDAFMRRTEKALGPTMWLALFQGRPRNTKGALLKIDKVKFHDSIDEFPKGLKWGRVWDYAHTEAQRSADDPDYTSGTLLAFQPLVDRLERDEVQRYAVWVRHVWRCRDSAPARDRGIRTIAEMDGPGVRIGVEDTLDTKDSLQNLRLAVGASRRVEAISVVGDKVVRATPLEAIFENGDVHILRGEWNTEWLDEIAAFPHGRHDDQVDNLSSGYKMLTGAPSVRRVRVR